VTPDLSWMLDPKVLVGGLWSALLVVVGAVLVMVRGRVRVLRYVVVHNAVAISAKDDSFGHIEVRLAGGLIDRLWMTTVTLTNDTGKDFEALPIRIYANDDTLLFGERTEVTGTTFKIDHAPEFVKKLALPAGTAPDAEQQHLFNHRRDYVIPVLNRGESAKWHLLTTVKDVDKGQTPIQGPSVWCDLLKAGVKLRHRVIGPQVLGVPTKAAVGIGLVATVMAYGIALAFDASPWAVALPGTIVGFLAPIIGAWVYKAVRLLLPMLVQ
jgi:hypothetical protein